MLLVGDECRTLKSDRPENVSIHHNRHFLFSVFLLRFRSFLVAQKNEELLVYSSAGYRRASL